MKKLSLFTVYCFLVCFSVSAQTDNPVIVFEGRKAPFMERKVLDLSYQNLSDLPYEANNLEIEILILDNNKIKKLPNWIANLKNLRVLSIRNNNLLELNSVVSFCKNLEQLYLSGNINLEDLPNLSPCEKLEIVDVIDTKINEVPGWIETLNSLFYFKYTETK
jgi:Leucine-rich repeat (LRR) protein